jgi:enoyl-CoA hydratase
MKWVATERRGPVTVVRIDRPPANALDRELGAELIEVAGRLRESGESVVLCGAGDFFSAGLDLKVVPTLGAAEQREMVMGVNRLVAAWTAIERPVVCAVTGHAIAGGLVLALCADYRVGADQGKLGLTEARAGVPFPAGAMAVVKAELPPPAARLLALGAGLVDPPRALELCVVDEVVPVSAVVERALAVAADLHGLPQEAYATVKAQVRGDLRRELQRIVDDEDDPLLEGWLSADTEAAAAARLRGDG